MATDVMQSVRATPLRRLFASAQSTAGTSFAQPADVLGNRPSGAGYIDVADGADSGPMPGGIFFKPYGIDTATETFLMGVWVVDPMIQDVNVASAQKGWTHSLLAAFTCTLGTAPGLAGGMVNGSQLYCSTIAVSVGNANVSAEAVSPTTSGIAPNNAATIRMSTTGASLLFVKLAVNGSSVNCNTLYRLF